MKSIQTIRSAVIPAPLFAGARAQRHGTDATPTSWPVTFYVTTRFRQFN